MNICILTSGMDPGAGGGRFSTDLVRGLRGAGARVLVLKENDDGFEGEAILSRGIGMVLAAYRVVRYAKKCDVVHALDLYPFGIIAFLANIVSRKPLVITLQGSYALAPLAHWRTAGLSRMALRAADALTAISNYTKWRVVGAVPGLDIRIINHGVWHEKVSQSRARGGTGLVVGVGALKQRKGYHIAIPAFAEVHKRIPSSRLVIVGDQRDLEYFAELRELVSRNQVEQSVEFRQNISEEELSSLYAQASVFLLPSINEGDHIEGFGLVFLEAAAHGVPAIGTTENGISDAIVDGKTGLLVPQGDIEATAKALGLLMSDALLWMRMSVACVGWAKEHDWPTIVRQYRDVYTSILMSVKA